MPLEPKRLNCYMLFIKPSSIALQLLLYAVLKRLLDSYLIDTRQDYRTIGNS
jgi:hypothetical protein